MRIQKGQWDLLCLYYVSLLNSLTPTTNYYHYTSAFLVAAVGPPFVSLALCWVGGAIGWPAVASGSALYYYILHLLYLSP